MTSAPDRVYTMQEIGLSPLPEVIIGGHTLRPAALPCGLVHRSDLGVVVPEGVEVQRIHGAPPPVTFAECPRVVKTPGGEYLLLYAAGSGHQIGNKTKVNDLYARRSRDGGRRWSPPTVAWPVPYNQHSANPLIPRGSRRIYTFQMEASFEYLDEPHQAPLGMRSSDDDGHSWSAPTFIRPLNDSLYQGVCHMQLCETDSGAWLLPTYTPIFDPERQRFDRQYLLRSEDQGQSWTLLPGARSDGWRIPATDRLMEGQVLSLGAGAALMYARESSGHLWELRSADDGRSWSGPDVTPLTHCDAPPMCYTLADGKTLINFIHNRPATQENKRRNDGFLDRQELWVTLSDDAGRTWSEPRFFASDVCRPLSARGWMELSYGDLLVDGDALHFFADHKKRQILHFSLMARDLRRLPARGDLLG